MSELLTTAAGSSVDSRPAGPSKLAACRTRVLLGPSTDAPTLVRTYLDESEESAFAAMDGWDQIPWLLGQVAAKDAVRSHLVQRSFAEFDPKRIAVDYDDGGRPSVRVQGARFSTRDVQGVDRQQADSWRSDRGQGPSVDRPKRGGRDKAGDRHPPGVS